MLRLQGVLFVVTSLVGHGAAEDGARRALEADVPSDTVALLQQGARPARAARQRVTPSVGRVELLINTSSGSVHPDLFECSQKPELCQDPFNCGDVDLEQAVSLWGVLGFSPKGFPNYRSWCANLEFSSFITKCIAGDVDGAAQAMYDKVLEYGEDATNYEASYCYLVGACDMDYITNDTSAQENRNFCDHRFGRQEWAQAGNNLFFSTTIEQMQGLLDQKRKSFETFSEVKPWALLSCAMGSYHCDMRYCHETFCKMDSYKQKFGHLLQA
uniref:Uncharacterized protein n=1 Tax=Alexandrium andersonii TaxID=327968 RepID=A0A7S2F640_9DINO